MLLSGATEHSAIRARPEVATDTTPTSNSGNLIRKQNLEIKQEIKEGDHNGYHKGDHKGDHKGAPNMVIQAPRDTRVLY